MASELYFSPFIPAFSNTGVPIGSAKLYFFYTGTVILAPIWADEARTIPLTNPVQANLAGKNPDIYLDDTILYRVRQTDKDDVQIGDDIDPYVPGTVVAFTDSTLRAQLIATTGASLVGFTYDGVRTGRTVEGGLKRLPVDVMQPPYNAIGDGVTDDYAAIAAAVATGRDILFPVGFTFLTSSTLIPQPQTTWWGYGATLRGGNNNPVLQRIETNHAAVPGTKTQISIRGLKIDGGGAFNGPVIKYTKVSNVDFTDCEIFNRTGTNGVGIELEEVYWWEIVRPYIFDCTYACVNLTKTMISGSNQGSIHGGRLIGNNRPLCVAIRADGVQNLMVDRVDLEGSGNGLTGITLTGCEGPVIRGCYIELWTDKAVDLSGGGNRRVVITNNFVNSGILSGAGGVIHLNTASTPNENVEVSFNRGGDILATQTFLQIGNCTNGYEFNNDPAAAKATENISAGSNGYKQVTVLKKLEPTNITLGASARTSGVISVEGARRGDPVALSHSDAQPSADYLLTGIVTSDNTVRWLCQAIDAVTMTGSLIVHVYKQ